MLKKGSILDDRYEIHSQVGQGGMALIYHGKQLSDGKDVAIKVLLDKMAQDTKNAVAVRFKREFTSCAKLNHRNIIKLYHMGEVKDGQLYYAMEYLPTQDLDAVIMKHAPLNQKQTYFIVKQIVAAFSCYHKADIVHRDLKPGNLMLCDDGRLVLVDFGLAKDFDKTALTATNCLIGTPLYMSPEVMKGKTAGPGSDIFALGIIAYEMLTGQNPFKSKSLPELAGKLANLIPPPVTDFVPELAGEWNPFLEKCLKKDLNDRFSSAEEMVPLLKDLALVISGKKASAYADGNRGATAGDSSESQTAASAKSDKNSDSGKKVKKSRSRKNRKSVSTETGSSANGKSGINAQISSSSVDISLQSEKRTRMILRVAIPVLFFIALISVFTFSRMQSPTAAANAIQITHSPLPGGITIRWRSDLPYRSQIKLLKPEQQLITGSSSSDVTSHEVHVTGFTSNQVIEYVVVYPSGETSLPNSVKSGSKTITIDSVKVAGKGFTIRWKNTIPGSSVSCVVKGRELSAFRALEPSLASLKVAMEDSDFCSVNIPAPVELISDIEVVLSSKSRGTFKLSIAQSLIPQIKALSDQLNLVPPDKIVVEARDLVDLNLQKASEATRKKNKVESLSTNQLERLRAELRTKYLHSILSDKGLLKSYDEVSQISVLAFGLGDIPFAKKKKLYKGCMSILKLVVFSSCYNQRNRIILPSLPYMAGFTRSTKIQDGSNDTINCFTSDTPKGFKLGTTQVSLTHRPMQQLKFSFNLEDHQVTNMVWAQMAILQSSFSHMIVRIFVNGNDELILYDTPVIKHAKSRRIVNYQRIPVLYLRKGTNNVVFETVQLFGDVGERNTLIPSISLKMNTE